MRWSHLFSGTFTVVVAVGMALSLVEPAFAGNNHAVPAPLLGAGLPALAILAGGFWLVRKIRERR